MRLFLHVPVSMCELARPATTPRTPYTLSQYINIRLLYSFITVQVMHSSCVPGMVMLLEIPASQTEDPMSHWTCVPGTPSQGDGARGCAGACCAGACCTGAGCGRINILTGCTGGTSGMKSPNASACKAHNEETQSDKRSMAAPWVAEHACDN